MSVNLENPGFGSLLDGEKITLKSEVFVLEIARNPMFASSFLLLEKRCGQKKKYCPGEGLIDYGSTLDGPRGFLHHRGHKGLERNVEGKINMGRKEEGLCFFSLLCGQSAETKIIFCFLFLYFVRRKGAKRKHETKTHERASLYSFLFVHRSSLL